MSPEREFEYHVQLLRFSLVFRVFCARNIIESELSSQERDVHWIVFITTYFNRPNPKMGTIGPDIATNRPTLEKVNAGRFRKKNHHHKSILSDVT